MTGKASVARRAKAAAHMHFENLTTKPPVFQIKPEYIRAVKRGFPEVSAKVTTSYGANLSEIDTWLPRTAALVTSYDVLTHPSFPLEGLSAAAPALRWIHLTSAGIEKVLPLTWLPDNITLTNNSGIHGTKSGEFALMSMLMLHARIPQLVTQQARAEWRQVYTRSIVGSTIAVIGLGGIGSNAARQAKYLGMNVIGVRRHPEPHPHVDRLYPLRQLHAALKKADIVYVSVPLTPETEGLIGAREFDVMKHGAALVNVSRAGTVDYAQLASRLRDGRLSGAVLDVFDPEPLPPTSDLWSVPNLIMTPHIGMDDVDRYIPLSLEHVFRNLKRFQRGKPLENAVDAKLGY